MIPAAIAYQAYRLLACLPFPSVAGLGKTLQATAIVAGKSPQPLHTCCEGEIIPWYKLLYEKIA